MKVEEITVEEFMQIIEKKLALLIKQEAREELEKAERIRIKRLLEKTRRN